MGLNFSYILYFSRERWWEALEGVAQRVDSDVVNSVFFPEGERQIALPSWGIRSKIPFTHETPVLRFATSLSFKEDLFILEYLKDLDPSSVHRSPPDDDGVNWYKIGLIYIDVYNDVSEYSRSLNDPNLVVMTFTAASTNMSLLFWNHHPSARDLRIYYANMMG